MLEFMMVWWKGPLRTFLISSSSLKEEIFHGKKNEDHGWQQRGAHVSMRLQTLPLSIRSPHPL